MRSSCNAEMLIPMHRCQDVVASIFQLKNTQFNIFTFDLSVFRFVLSFMCSDLVSVCLGAYYVVENLNGFEYLKEKTR